MRRSSLRCPCTMGWSSAGLRANREKRTENPIKNKTRGKGREEEEKRRRKDGLCFYVISFVLSSLLF